VTFLLQQFAPGVVAGGLVAFLVALAARWLPADWRRQLAWAAAVGGGYAAGHAKVANWPAFPPADVTHWLLFSALASIGFGALYGSCRDGWSRVGQIGSLGVLLLATLGLILVPKFKYGWSTSQGVLWLTGLVLASVPMAWTVDRTLQDRGGRWSTLWVLMLWIGISLALALSGSMLLGQLAAVSGAVVFGLVVNAAISGTILRAIVPGLTTLFTGLLVCGYFYAELPWTSGMLLALAPLLALLLPGKRTSFRWELLRTLVVTVPVIAAVILAYRASPKLDYY